MVSLRKIGECLGLSEGFSVVHDFLGYRIDFSGRKISLLRQLQLLKNGYINLNIIRVGVDALHFTAADDEEISFAIQTTRNIYAAVNLGVGRIGHFEIPLADSKGRDIISDDAEAKSLTDEFTVPNTWVNVFIVLNAWAGTCGGCSTVGISAIDGPCDKYTTSARTGVIVTLGSTSPDLTGQTLAHELGHYLGLSHVCEFAPGGSCLSGTCTTAHQSSLMFPCTMTTAVTISDEEFRNMSDHCFVNAGCAG
jgi:reprolysin-like metallo-peptidase family M12B